MGGWVEPPIKRTLNGPFYYVERGDPCVDKQKLSNAEFESVLLYVLISFSMAIRGIVIFTTSESSINNSSFYSRLDSIITFNIWGVAFLVGAVIIMLSPISQTTRRYHFLIVGNVLGAITGIFMGGIGFIESHQTFTPIQILSIAFFNLILIIHSGRAIWTEKRKIHTLRKST